MFKKTSRKSPAETVDLEIWVAWCAGGDHVTGKSEEEVQELAADDLNGPMISCARMTLTVPLPEATEIEAKVEPQDVTALVIVQS